MDVTFVLEESGVSATVEVPCDVDVAAAKEVACTALAVLPASVEMRIGTQVLEETCRLQDTAFESGVQVVLAFPCADIRCPDDYEMTEEVAGASDEYEMVKDGDSLDGLSLSHCGKLCIYLYSERYGERCIGGFDTEIFEPSFLSNVDSSAGRPAISRCKTRCYLPCGDHFRVVALPGGELLRKFEGTSKSVFTCGSVVVSQGNYGVYVYDEDLTLLRSLSHTGCEKVSVSHCGGWVITSSRAENNTRVWDINTGVSVACVPVAGHVAVSQSASAFAVGVTCKRKGTTFKKVHLYDWSGTLLGTVDVRKKWSIQDMQFTPFGKYLVMAIYDVYNEARSYELHQYDVATRSHVRGFPGILCKHFAISPCSRMVVMSGHTTATRHLYPLNSE